jgi:hypothetical protein
MLLINGGVLAWSPAHLMRGSVANNQPSLHHHLRSVLLLAKQTDKTNNDLIKDETGKEKSQSASFGVSYIGGDPCGSKYNNDPFDATKEEVFKPGFPDDMKDRIAALAAKKLKEQKNN